MTPPSASTICFHHLLPPSASNDTPDTPRLRREEVVRTVTYNPQLFLEHAATKLLLAQTLDDLPATLERWSFADARQALVTILGCANDLLAVAGRQAV